MARIFPDTPPHRHTFSQLNNDNDVHDPSNRSRANPTDPRHQHAELR
jgi:hypothetical protein